MSTETFMAGFKQTTIEADVYSEADSVSWKYELAGGTLYSPAGYFKRNGVAVGNPANNAINVRSLASIGATPVITSYVLSSDNSSSINTGFVNAMNAQTNKLIVLYTTNGIKSSQVVDDWFAAAGSVNWPGAFMCNNYSCGYVGFYMPSRKKIIAEAAIFSDGNELGTANYVAIADEVNDIGVLGFPKRVVYDLTEYSTTTGYEYKRYLSDSAILKTADYGLTDGATVMLAGDLLQSQSMLDASMKTRINLRWYSGTTLLDATTVLEVTGTSYKNAIGYSTMPANTDGFTIVVSRYPRNDAITGLSSVKNVVFTEVSRNPNKANSRAIIGVNGIKSGGFIESQTDNHLMELKINSTSATNIVNIVGITEGDSGTPPKT